METMSYLKNVSMSGLLVMMSTDLSAQVANEVTKIAEQPSTSNNVTAWGLIILLIIQVIVIRSISSAIKSVSESNAVSKRNGSSSLMSLLFLSGLLFSHTTFAQTASTNNDIISFSETEVNILIGLNIFCSLIVIWMYTQFRYILKQAGIISQEEKSSSIFGNIEQWLTRAVPVEKEATIQFEHEYDSIRELDNVLPPWWLWMFYVTIIFSVVYLIHYHVSPVKAFEKIGFVGPGVGQEELYKMEVQEAEQKKQEYLAVVAGKINEENVTALSDANEIQQGKEIFTSNCVTCHGKEGQGGAGPNLTDDYWLHGGGIKNIFKTIKYGVPEKGMIAWESQLSPKQIQQVASFILTLRGTNPPGAKEPQGELWTENKNTTDTTKSNNNGNN